MLDLHESDPDLTLEWYIVPRILSGGTPEYRVRNKPCSKISLAVALKQKQKWETPKLELPA